MPTGDHSRDAIAISTENGTTLISAYTLMFKWIIAQLWALIVLGGVAIFIGRKPSHNRAAATVGIWNAHSPTNVAMLTARYVFHMKNEIWYPIVWAVLAAIILASGIVGPILLSRYLVIGHAAPVNPLSIYVPDMRLKSDNQQFENILLDSPAAFRAVSAPASTDNVYVSQTGNLSILYGYNVSGADFGLQHAPDLSLSIQGSCLAEYGWYIGTDTDSQDGYNPFGDPPANASGIWLAGPQDQGPPFAFFYQSDSDIGGGYNLSWAMIASSAGRPSVTSSDDPWYQTQPGIAPFISANINSSFYVSNGRPALSCWETAIWSYRGSEATISNLTSLPGLDVQEPLQQVLETFLGFPMILLLGPRLGRSVLASSATAIGPVFDAGSSSILQDFQRLVLASYTATRNVLVETTMYQGQARYGITNLAAPTGSPLAGVADFVVPSQAVTTFSVRTLIIVPVVLCVLLALNLLVGLVPAPWRFTHALHASVLYSHLHEAAMRKHGASASGKQATSASGEETKYKRRTRVAHSKDPAPTAVRPTFTKEAGLAWQPTE